MSIRPNRALGRRASWTSELWRSARCLEAQIRAVSLEIYADPPMEVLAACAASDIQPSTLPLLQPQRSNCRDVQANLRRDRISDEFDANRRDHKILQVFVATRRGEQVFLWRRYMGPFLLSELQKRHTDFSFR
jgi:hypothetical protein